MVLLKWLSPISAPQFMDALQLLDVPPLELKSPLLVGLEAPSQDSIVSLSPHKNLHHFTQLSL